MAFPRINRHTTIVTVPTASTTLSLLVCLCFSSQPLSQDDGGGYFPQCLRHQAVRHGKPCVTCQDTSRNVTLPGRAAEDRQERRVPATDRRPDSSGQHPEGMWISLSRCGAVFPSVPCHHKSIGDRSSSSWRAGRATFVEMKRYWTLPKSCGSQSSEWEERKKSRAGSGSLCEPRNLARQSHRPPIVAFFHLSSKGMWLVAYVFRGRRHA